MRILVLTAAERRLAVLLFILALLGSGTRVSRRLSPEVRAWLEQDPEPPAESGPVVAVPRDSTASVPPGTDASAAEISHPAISTDGLDPNTARAAELETLPGVGPVLAARIVADRAAHGPYRRAEDLRRVKGIGAATLAKLRPHLTLK